MPKVLFCATVDYHFLKFHIPYFKWFKEQGWEVHVAAKGDLDLPHVDRKYDIDIRRSPFHLRNINAFLELKKVIDVNKYDIIHCHTPMGGVLARLAAWKARKRGAKVLYTAHGFHFCKGAPLVNWLLYYPIERGLAYLTDCLITINSEDYALALRHRFKAGRVEHVHGVGIDIDKYRPADPEQKDLLRQTFGFRPDDILLFYAAEFNKNKNQQFLIESFALIKDKIPAARLLLAGDGTLIDHCRKLAAHLGVEARVDFLGYRDDVQTLLSISDVAVASSFREGLPVNIMEAMASGLPVVAVRNRGHSELIAGPTNGFLVAPGDHKDFAERLIILCRSEQLRRAMGFENMARVKKYSLSEVKAELAGIYKEYMPEGGNEAENQYNRAYI